MKVFKKIIFSFFSLLFLLLLGYILFAISLMIYYEINFNQIIDFANKILININTNKLKVEAYFFISIIFIPGGLFLLVKIKELLEFLDYGNADYGKATFSTLQDIKDMELNFTDGLVLGKKKNKSIRFDKSLALLIVAPPGTGKSASIVIPNLLEVKQSSIILDIKGELTHYTRDYREKVFKNKILIFNPFGEDNSIFYNPLDNSIVKDMNFSEKSRLVEEVAEVLFSAEKGKEPDHWVKSAKTLFSFFALYDLCTKNHSTLPKTAQAPIRDYYDELNENYKKQAQKEDEETQEEIRDDKVNTLKLFFYQTANSEPKNLYGTTKEEFQMIQNEARRFSTAAQEEFASIISTFDTYMKVFKNPNIIKVTNSMNFNYEDFRNEKITLYIKIRETDISILTPIIKILLESTAKNLMSRENSNKEKFIYFYLDEFTRFGYLKYLIELPQICRSKGVIPIFISQSYNQIKKQYTNEDMEMLISNCHIQLVYRMSNTDEAQIISKTIGNFTRKKISISKGEKGSKNISENKEGYALLSPQDIMNQDKENVMILVGGYKNKPLILNRNLFFQNPDYKGKYNKERFSDFK